MKSEEIIKEIAIYLGETELQCKHCGSVTPTDDVVIETKYSSSHKASYYAHCPDCEGFLKKMRQDKKSRVFWKGSMIDIGKFDSGLLLWMLQIGYTKNKNVEDAIGKLLWDRTEIPNIKDIKISKRELMEIEHNKTIKDKQAEIADNVAKWDKEIESLHSADYVNWDYYETKKHNDKIRFFQRRNKKLVNELASLKV